MPIDKLIIKLRLDKILTMCQHLEEIHTRGKREYLQSDMLQAASERELHIAIQAMIDIGTHIIAQNRWGAPETYSASISILAQQKVIPPPLATRLVQMVKLRNVIIHMYLDLNPEIVFKSLPSILTDLNAFVQIIREYVKTKTK